MMSVQPLDDRTLCQTNRSALWILCVTMHATARCQSVHDKIPQRHEAGVLFRNINSIVLLKFFFHLVPTQLLFRFIQLLHQFLHQLLDWDFHIIQSFLVLDLFSPSGKLYCGDRLIVIDLVCRACCDDGCVGLSWKRILQNTSKFRITIRNMLRIGSQGMNNITQARKR